MSCKEAMSAMLGVVEHGGAIPEAQREHLKNCARCRELLESVNALDSEMHEEPVPAPAVDELRLFGEVRNVRLRDVARRMIIAAAIAVVVIFPIGWYFRGADTFAVKEVITILIAATVAAIIPMLLFYSLIAAVRDRNGNRIYKRLKPGRQLSGVCLGLSEATGISVVVFRLAFLALTFGQGIGIFLYILLDLAMPVHPDDRQYMLRFKLRRMWQRRFAHADHDPR